MHRVNIILVVIFILSILLRSYNISNNPPALYGDELSFAWNAWNILKTGTDEYGQALPLQFRAFNDYKSPIPVYLLVPVFAVFGMNTLSVRLPVAIIGSLTVLTLYFFVKEIFKNINLVGVQEKVNIQNAKQIALISALLLAISPWHINLSRGYFESTLSLLPFILGVYFFIKALNAPKLMIISMICFIVSLYTYFTPRIILLIFLPFLFVLFRNNIIKNYKKMLVAWFIFIILCLPLVKMSLFDKGTNRFQYLITDRMSKAITQSTQEYNIAGGPQIFKKILHNRFVIFSRLIANDYLEQLSINYWYIYGDSSLRYSLGNMGMFYLIELPFFIIGSIALLSKKSKLSLLFLGWLLITPLSAAISGKPYAVRSLLIIPIPIILTSFGLWISFIYINNYKNRIIKLSKYIIIFLFLISFGIYLERYHFDYIKYSATWWGWENKTAIDMAIEESSKYDHIFISNFYTGVDLAFAVYTSYDPLLYRQVKAKPVILADGRQQYQFGKYYIGSLDLDQKRITQNLIPAKSLYIGRPEEADSNENITAPDDGRILFKIYRTQ